MRKPLFNTFAEIHVPQKGIHWEETMQQASEAVKDLPKFDYSTLPVVVKTDEQIMADMELQWFFRDAGM